MPGSIQNAVNQIIRSAMFSARKGVFHAGQTGKDTPASGEAAPLVAPSAPKASEIAAKVARENLTPSRVGLSSPGIISKRGGFCAPDGDSAGS